MENRYPPMPSTEELFVFFQQLTELVTLFHEPGTSELDLGVHVILLPSIGLDDNTAFHAFHHEIVIVGVIERIECALQTLDTTIELFEVLFRHLTLFLTESIAFTTKSIRNFLGVLRYFFESDCLGLVFFLRKVNRLRSFVTHDTSR